MARGVPIVKIAVDGAEVDAKACTKCGEVKPLTEYQISRSSKSGRVCRCRACSTKTEGALRRNRWDTQTFRDEIYRRFEGTLTLESEYRGQHKYVWVRHTECGDSRKTTPNTLLRDKATACHRCANKALADRRRKPDILFRMEVDNLTGNEYVAISRYKNAKSDVLFRHTACGNEFLMTPRNFRNGQRCPKCARTKAAELQRKPHDLFVKELATLHGTEIRVLGNYKGSHAPIKVMHEYCGESWEASPSNLLKGTFCPRCKESKGERRIKNWLDEEGISYVGEETFEGCAFKKPLRFDVVIYRRDITVAIEFDGEHHHYPVIYGKNEEHRRKAFERFRERQRNDRIKTDYCRSNGIPLIRIDYTQFDEIETILKRELTKYGVLSSETGNRLNYAV